MSAAGKRLIKSARQALAIARGEAARGTYRMTLPERVDVKAIRRRLSLSQTEFARRFGFSIHTLRKWEQNGRQPEGPARAYLRVIAHDPQAVEAALRRPA
jgi:putative transcriptional regulator